MNQQKLERVAKKLEDIASKMVDARGKDIPLGWTIMVEGNPLTMLPDQVEEFRDILNDLINKEGWGEKFSEKFIDDRLQKILVSLASEHKDETAAQHLLRLLEEYANFDTVHTVYIPLVGVVIPSSELELGNIRLVNITQPAIDAVLDNARSIIDQTTHTLQEKVSITQRYAEDISQNLTRRLFAVYQVNAEPSRALERGEEETRRALELLRFAAASFRSDNKMVIGLAGEANRVLRWSLAISEKHVSTNSRVIGAVVPLELTDDRLAHMEKIGVFVLSNVLRKAEADISDFERTLLRSLHWFSSAQTQGEPENRFLNLVTSLETLLTPRDGNPIGTAIAEGVALLLSDNLADRKRVKRRIKELYQQRSAVSHGGKKPILDSDLRELEVFSGSLLMVLIHRRAEFSSQKALLDWLEDAKLA